MVKRLLPLTIILLLSLITVGFSQIRINTIDQGPYTPESSIAATFSLGTDCIKPGNKFNLYLVAPGGAETEIGYYDGFYSTFVNGTIPKGTPAGTGYILRVKSTIPVLVSNDSNPFEIKSGGIITAQVKAPAAKAGYPDVFGFCENRPNAPIYITNESTSGGTTTATITNGFNPSQFSVINFDPIKNFEEFTPGAAHYTMVVKVKMPNLTVATKAYLIINNVVNTAFSTSGNGVVCLPEGELVYRVDVSTSGGIQNNFPGNLYKIVWGDGSEDSYTLCELLKNQDIVHNYTKSSCGYTFDEKHNVFRINVSTQSPFCNKIGTELSTYAKVVTVTENIFTGPTIACVNTNITFNNTSKPGQNQDGNSDECTDNNITFNWYIDGKMVLPNAGLNTPLVYKFLKAGEYEITLESVSSGRCQGVAVTKTICIQDTPIPEFNFPGNSTAHCAPFTITANNTSFVDNRCGTIHTYNWIVTRSGLPALPSEVTFTNGIRTPEFKFLKQGSYEVSLQISSPPCGVVSTTPPQTVVIIDGAPVTKLEPKVTLCGLGEFTYSDEVTGPTNVQFSGTEVDAADTYTWTVTTENDGALTNADYTFKDGKNIVKFPTIEFKQYRTYKVSVTHKNSCGEITTSQLITFKESPTPSIIADPICYNDKASIIGSTSNNNYINVKWTTPPGGGTFLVDDALTTTYTPSLADKTAGKATVTLTINTGIEGDCEFVSVSKEITIHPNNTGNHTAQTICTGSTVTELLSSSVAGSTFSWTAINEDQNALGFSASGTNNIIQTVTNKSTTENAVVVYTIIPEANGCPGVPFTFTLTVTPKPIIDPIADKTICAEQAVGLTITSNIATRFIWTSVPSIGIRGNSNPTTKSIASKTFIIPDVLENDTFEQGTVTYTIKSYSDSEADCPGNEIIVVVKVDPKVTEAIAGPSESICATSPSNTYTLKGNEPKVGTGKWTLISTHTILPTITDPNSFETKVTGMVAGDPYTFEWAITGNGKCANTKDEVTITVTPLPVISASVMDKTICHGSPAAIAITSDIPTRFTWTSTATIGLTGNTGAPTPTVLSPVSRTITINDALFNSTYAQGSVTYTITPYSETGCAGDPIVIVVKVDPEVTTAEAGQDESICNTTTYHLKGSKPEVGTGVWTLVSATSMAAPTVTNPTITTPANFETGVTGLEAGGIYTFKWTITGTGKCALSEDDVTITVNMPTIPGTTSGTKTVCENNNEDIITLSGNTGAVLAWQSSIDNGATWQNITGVNTGLTYTYTNLTITTQFRAVVQNAGCTILYSTPSTITVAPATTIAKAGADQTLCAETTVLLKGNALATGEIGEWTMVSGDANAIIPLSSNPEVTVTGLLPGITYVFRWTINGNNPCGPTRDEVTIRNNKPIDENSITTNAEVCNGQQVTINGSIPTGGAENGQYNYAWESKIGAGQWEIITGETGEDLTVTLTQTGNISFRRIVNSGTCTSTSNEFSINVQPPIAGNTIQGDQPICSGITPNQITGSEPTGGDGSFLYQWQSSLDGSNWTNIPGAIAQNFQPPILTITTHYRRIVSTLACNGNLQNISAAVKITVTPNAKAEFTWGSTDVGCFPYVLPIQVVTHPDRNAVYTWYADNTEIGVGAAFPGYTIENSGEPVTIKLVVTSSLGCSNDVFSHTFRTNLAVPPSFDVSDPEGCGPLAVNFTNTSILTAGATFEWDFGNGQSSTNPHPSTVIYDQDPTGKDTTYVVTLKSITSCGTSSITKNVFVKAKPIAVFTPDRVEVCSPFKITFTNTSPGGTNTYYYDFGDDSPIEVKNDKSPVEHIYDVKVTTVFTVKMVAENSCGRDEKEWEIRVFPQNITPVLGVKLEEIQGCAPHTVHFENNSIGASKYVFDFGDGSPILTTFTAGIVPYTYTKGGTFTITMTAYNSCSEITITKSVTVLAQPVADFEAENTLGCPGVAVKFKNNSEGGLSNSYAWDFGDGSPISNEFEPEHIYNGDQEYYTVKLLVTNQLGCPIEFIKNQYIHVVPPPIAAFNVNPSTLISIPDYTFKFEDESTNSPTIWEWDFGDGLGSSTLKNPSYTYLDTGTYKVSLKVTNQNGCFTTTFKNVTIKGVPGYLFVPNSFIPGSPRPELRVFSAKGSGIQTWRFSVFNKWGQILWETTNLEEGRPTQGWDGTFKGEPMPQGVYYWKIDVQMVNGSEWKGMTYDKTPPKRTGAIHLIR